MQIIFPCVLPISHTIRSTKRVCRGNMQKDDLTFGDLILWIDKLSWPNILLVQCCNMYRLVTTFIGLIYHTVRTMFQYICTNWIFFFTYKTIWNLPLYFHVDIWYTCPYCWAVRANTGSPYSASGPSNKVFRIVPTNIICRQDACRTAKMSLLGNCIELSHE